jgi:CheY-like chemotaxis protein
MKPNSPSPISPHLAGRRALVAEDSRAQQRLLSYVLEKAGVTIVMVEDGHEAVKRATLEPFDIVLLDMQMPELDGYEAAGQLRQLGYRGPILALTADSRPGDEQRCLDAGCDGYLAKPVQPAELLGLLMRHLVGTRPAAPQPAPAGASFGELLNQYVHGLGKRLHDLHAALAANDLPTLAQLAHKTRGAAAMYGLTGIAETAGLIEDAVDEGQDRVLLEELLAELEKEVQIVAPR